MCGWACCDRPPRSRTARTRGRPATGRWTPGAACTRTSCGSTALRCRRARRSPAWPASSTRGLTCSWREHCSPGRSRSSADLWGAGRAGWRAGGGRAGALDRRASRGRAGERGWLVLVQVVDEREGRAPAGGDVAGRCLGLAHHPQDVAVREPRAVGLAPAAADQLGEQGRITGHVHQALGQLVGAVVVPAEADVIGTRDLPDMLDVVGDLGEGGRGSRVTGGPLVLLLIAGGH